MCGFMLVRGKKNRPSGGVLQGLRVPEALLGELLGQGVLYEVERVEIHSEVTPVYRYLVHCSTWGRKSPEAGGKRECPFRRAFRVPPPVGRRNTDGSLCGLDNPAGKGGAKSKGKGLRSGGKSEKRLPFCGRHGGFWRLRQR